MRKIIKDRIQAIKSDLRNNWFFEYLNLTDNADKNIKIELNDSIITFPKKYRINAYLEQIFYRQLPEILIFNKYRDEKKIFGRFVKKTNFESFCYFISEEKIRYFFVINLSDCYALRDFLLSNEEETKELFNDVDNIVICSLTKTGSLVLKDDKEYMLNNQLCTIKLMEYLDLAKEILVESEFNYLCEKIEEINQKTYKLLAGSEDESFADLNGITLNIIEKCLHLNTDENRLLAELKIDKSEYITLLNNYKRNKENLELDYKNDWGRPFTTSEWIYQNALVIPMFDFTFIGAGYIKTVEQLIYSMIYDFFPKFTFFYNNKEYSLHTNEGKEKFMIGPFITYLEYDKSEMLFNKNEAQLLIRLLKPWRQDVRNDHFHKDNIKNFELLNNIRYSTCLVIFALIACIKPLKYDWEIDDSEFDIVDETETNSVSNEFKTYDINDLPF